MRARGSRGAREARCTAGQPRGPAAVQATCKRPRTPARSAPRPHQSQRPLTRKPLGPRRRQVLKFHVVPDQVYTRDALPTGAATPLNTLLTADDANATLTFKKETMGSKIEVLVTNPAFGEASKVIGA